MILPGLRSRIFHLLAFILLTCASYAQCPMFTGSSVSGNTPYMCEGEMMTITLSGQNIPPGSTIQYYIGSGNFNPYIGEGDLIGSVGTNPIPNFTWTVPSTFCEDYGVGSWTIV